MHSSLILQDLCTVPTRFYESLNDKNWMYELLTFSQICSHIIIIVAVVVIIVNPGMQTRCLASVCLVFEIAFVRKVSMHVCLCLSVPWSIKNYSHEIKFEY